MGWSNRFVSIHDSIFSIVTALISRSNIDAKWSMIDSYRHISHRSWTGRWVIKMVARCFYLWYTDRYWNCTILSFNTGLKLVLVLFIFKYIIVCSWNERVFTNWSIFSFCFFGFYITSWSLSRICVVINIIFEHTFNHITWCLR